MQNMQPKVPQSRRKQKYTTMERTKRLQSEPKENKPPSSSISKVCQYQSRRPAHNPMQFYTLVQ